MKILLTMNIPYFPALGGANKSNRYMSERLAEKGHSVRIVVPALGTPSNLTYSQWLGELSAQGISAHADSKFIVAFKLNDVQVQAVADQSKLRPFLIEQIREFEPDVIIVSSEDPSQSLLEAALQAGSSRIVYLVRTTAFLPFGPEAFFPSASRTRLIGEASAIVAVSEFVAHYIRRWSGLDAAALPISFFGSGPFPLFGRFNAGFATMVNPCAIKGISIFLALAEDLPDIQFAAVPGWGTTSADRAAMERLPNVQLLKPAENIDEIFTLSCVFLVPSLWAEARSRVIVEAMLRGIPVLASDVGGNREVKLGIDYVLPVRPIERFTDELDENMLPVPVVPEQDVSAWQDVLCRLFSDRELYEKQSAVERETALRFSSQLSIAPFEDFLISVAAKSNSRSAPLLTVRKDVDRANPPSSSERTFEEIAGLTPEQRSLLILRLRKNALERAERQLEVPPIRPIPRDGGFPVSLSQERLCFLDQLEPGSAVYNMNTCVRLSGQLNLFALEQTVSEIIRRHEILRTTFPIVDGRPIQLIHPQQPQNLAVIELSELPESEREAAAMRIANKEAGRPFDLAQAPLLRAKLLKLAEEDQVLVLVMHHIVSDGWSMGVLIQEMASLYEAYREGRESPLEELPIQYGDFAVWQREWLKGEVLEKQISYWRKQLAGAPKLLELPTDRHRAAIQTSLGARQPLLLPKSLAEELKVLSHRERVTLFMALLAAFKATLHYYSGQEDVAIGTDVANRSCGEVEGLVGFFINQLVLRTNLSGNPTFQELLQRVREVALGAYAHQDLPFAKLVEALKPERDLSRNPLFQVLFVLHDQNPTMANVALPGLRVSAMEIDSGMSPFDFSLHIHETSEGLNGSFRYNTDLFDATTIIRMGQHFETVLRNVVAHPDIRLNDLKAILAEADRQKRTIAENELREARLHKFEKVKRMPIHARQIG